MNLDQIYLINSCAHLDPEIFSIVKIPGGRLNELIKKYEQINKKLIIINTSRFDDKRRCALPV